MPIYAAALSFMSFAQLLSNMNNRIKKEQEIVEKIQRTLELSPELAHEFYLSVKSVSRSMILKAAEEVKTNKLCHS